ncbi:hypothetical protein PGTUg99_016638 [Puccinia graminis f. sp. tritici]|uniref:Uncharacterized protein n=1 Tax=Puccinia graminis f. sp. tritici TaxID=56615 RepID=A0A5B0PKP8_PUCGR|nr:hypothetical protein PGTUg99_016638 [Puccinia graminis f. sp. tritici]
MGSDDDDKLTDLPDLMKSQSAIRTHRLSYLPPSTLSERSQRRHTTGRISFGELTSVPKFPAHRPKSLECVPEIMDTREKRPSFYLARTPETTDEFVVLDPPASVTDEATLFPLQDDPAELSITIRSSLTGIIMGIIGSAVGLLFIFKPVMVYLAPVFLQVG